MKDTIDFLYTQKKLSNEWVHLIPSEEERLAHEKFDDTLTKEQRILLREYERQHLLRIDKLNREVFESGFFICENPSHILQAKLQRFSMPDEK